MRRRVIALAVASVTVLAGTGCKVGPDYERPDVEVGETFGAANEAPVLAGEVEPAWWRTFEDTQLAGLVERALEENDSIAAALASIRESRALLLQARLDLFPVVTGRGGYQRLRFSEGGNFPLPDRDLWSAGFDATWELDVWGRVRRGVESARAIVEAQIAETEDLQVSVAAEVGAAYFDLRGAQLELQVARQNAEIQRQTVGLTESRLRGGRGTDFDVARAEAQLLETEATIPPLEARVRTAIHRLGVLTGDVPTALAEELSVSAPFPESVPAVAIGDPSSLLRRRPDVRAAERSLAADTAFIGVEVADLFPRFTAGGSVGVEGRSFGDMFESGAGAFALGPSFSWAAFDLYRVKARIRGAEARRDASIELYELTVRSALEDLENAVVALARETERRDLLERAAASNRRAARLAEARYREGVEDFLVALDAQARLLESERLLAISTTQVFASWITLYKALGGGWTEEVDGETVRERMPKMATPQSK